jgi:Na+/proline symporter
MILTRQPQQAKVSFCLAAFILAALSLAIAFIAFSCLITNPSVAPDFVLVHILGAHVPPVLKGIAIAGLFAAIMSTADSYLNVAGVTLTRDCIKPIFLPRLTDAKELHLARLSTCVIGTLGLLGALFSQRILSLGMAACACWAPVVVVPLWAGLLGYRASGRTFLVAVGAGQLVFWLWTWRFDSGPGGMIAIIPAMVANAAAFALARRWDDTATLPPQTTPGLAAPSVQPAAAHLSLQAKTASAGLPSLSLASTHTFTGGSRL